MSKFYRRSCSGFVLLLLFAAYALMSSCISAKKIVYFKDLPDTFSTPLVKNATPFVDPKIETNDLLAISIQPRMQMVMGSPNSSNSSSPSGSGSSLSGAGSSPGGANNSGGNSAVNTFPVDKNGYIDYFLIGPVKVGGLTTAEARELIKKKAEEFIKDPVVSVKITNFDISIFGDISATRTYTSPSEKVSILDAIVQGGDLQLSARRDNIMLIRTDGDKKIFARYDISSAKIFENPYYYLKQRDIIYVEPNKYKVQSSDQTFIRNLGILSSLISIASLILVYRSVK